jgi:hypothetical protein
MASGRNWISGTGLLCRQNRQERETGRQPVRAVVYDRFGPTDVLRLDDVKRPIPGESEVLVKTYATTVAIEDVGMRASPGLNGFTKPRKPILGFYSSRRG